MKQLRCKPGDMALIVGLRLDTEHNGQICDVLRSAAGYVNPIFNLEMDWLVQCGEKVGRIQDVNLIPLDGNPDTVAETRDEVTV